MAYPSVDFKPKSPKLGMQPISETSATQRHELGEIVWAFDRTYGEGEFVYLVGAASTAAGDVVAYNSKSGATTRVTTSTGNGPLAVAMSANTASRYGWYQISGSGPVNAATVSADAALYLTATAGQLDDSAVAGALVDGILSKAATSGGFATCQMNRPNMVGLGGSSGTNTGDVTIGTFGGTPTAKGMSISGQVITLEPASATHPGALLATNKATIDLARYITLSAAAEDSDAIVVTGQVKDWAGANIASAVQVVVRTLAVTADAGDITVTTGTEKKAVAPATGENVSWIETDATGGFAFSVANTNAEDTLVWVAGPNGITNTLKLTFAA